MYKNIHEFHHAVINMSPKLFKQKYTYFLSNNNPWFHAWLTNYPDFHWRKTQEKNPLWIRSNVMLATANAYENHPEDTIKNIDFFIRFFLSEDVVNLPWVALSLCRALRNAYDNFLDLPVVLQRDPFVMINFSTTQSTTARWQSKIYDRNFEFDFLRVLHPQWHTYTILKGDNLYQHFQKNKKLIAKLYSEEEINIINNALLIFQLTGKGLENCLSMAPSPHHDEFTLLH